MSTQLPVDNQPSRFLRWADHSGQQDNPAVRLVRKVLRLLLITITEFRNNDLSLRSGALTYTVLLSLVPVLAMSTAVVKGLGGGDQLRDVAYSYLDSLEESSSHLPPLPFPSGNSETPAPAPEDKESVLDKKIDKAEGLTSHLRSALTTLFDYVDNTNFATLGSFGVVGILLSVVLVFGNIETAMNRIWHVPDGRSIIRKVSDYITLMVLMPISINVAFAASAFLKNPTLSSKFELLIPFGWMQALILQLIPVFFITITFFVIYIFFPNTRVKHLPALLGAMMAAIFWFGIQNVYINLQVGVAKYNAIYGSFATLPLFLVWMYLGWLFILGGAQVAFAIQNIDSYRLVTLPAVPSIRLSAAFDILTHIERSYRDQRILTAGDLDKEIPGYDGPVITEILAEMTDGGLVCISNKDGRLLPTSPPETFDRNRLIELILGKETPETEGGSDSLRVLHGAKQAGRTTVVEPPQPGKGEEEKTKVGDLESAEK